MRSKGEEREDERNREGQRYEPKPSKDEEKKGRGMRCWHWIVSGVY